MERYEKGSGQPLAYLLFPRHLEIRGTSGSQLIAAFSYTLDSDGNRLSIDKQIPTAGTLPARNETATYSLNRLTSTNFTLYQKFWE